MISPYHIHLAIQLTFFYLRVCQIVLVSSILRWALFSVSLPRSVHLSGRSNVPTHNPTKPSRYKQLPINNWLAAMIPGPHRCLLSPDGVCGTSNLVYTRHM